MESFNNIESINNVQGGGLSELEQTKKRVSELQDTLNHKTELLGLATHQLRRPLTNIQGLISMILEEDFGEVPESLKDPLSTVLHSTDSMNKTINDFLDFSRIEQGAMRYYRKDFDFSNLVEEVVNEMRLAIQDNNLELRLNISKEPLLINGDKAKLKHVLLNLIDNASKYTKQGWIEISVEKKGDNQVLFAVKDSGIGISSETISLLFQKFSRSVEASKQNSIGTGLGLYVARKMLESHNGRIWVESAGEGQGSQFYVELPLLDSVLNK